MAKPMEEVFTPTSYKLAMEALAEELAKEELKQKDLSRSRLLEMHMIHKNGSTVPVEIKYTFLRDADTKPVGVLAIARDITERKRMEAALQDSESKYRTIFETTGVATVIVEEDATISLANTEFEKLSGYSKKEIEGKKGWAEFVAKDELERMKAYHRWRRIDPATAPKQYEFRFVDRRGNVKDIFLAVDLIPGTKRSVASLLDTTERKQMQEQLIVADRLATLGELVSGIAHELNNPLTSIIGFAQLLLAKDIPGDIKEDLNVIYEEAERTSKVVRNLLTFARKHEPEKKLVSLNEAIKVVLALRAYEQRVHNIQASTQFAPDLPEIMADGFQLQQVFLNIIINAEYFMTSAHGEGNLNVTTERVGDKVRASFADDGAGIPQENLSRLFDPFFTTKEVGKGTGLGLSICHGIVTEHGGSIYAQSKPGKGATFIVELPIS
jgi:PAS domain S-box-containing protein